MGDSAREAYLAALDQRDSPLRPVSGLAAGKGGAPKGIKDPGTRARWHTMSRAERQLATRHLLGPTGSDERRAGAVKEGDRDLEQQFKAQRAALAKAKLRLNSVAQKFESKAASRIEASEADCAGTAAEASESQPKPARSQPHTPSAEPPEVNDTEGVELQRQLAIRREALLQAQELCSVNQTLNLVRSETLARAHTHHVRGHAGHKHGQRRSVGPRIEATKRNTQGAQTRRSPQQRHDAKAAQQGSQHRTNGGGRGDRQHTAARQRVERNLLDERITATERPWTPPPPRAEASAAFQAAEVRLPDKSRPLTPPLTGARRRAATGDGVQHRARGDACEDEGSASHERYPEQRRRQQPSPSPGRHSAAASSVPPGLQPKAIRSWQGNPKPKPSFISDKRRRTSERANKGVRTHVSSDETAVEMPVAGSSLRRRRLQVGSAHGNTALMISADWGRDEVCRSLLEEAGAAGGKDGEKTELARRNVWGLGELRGP